ncbi:MAG: WYL domain-containing protein [Desulfobacterales bacterium]|jgi:predicted DNA-binding transcriptional regulator YafY|nr:WYL domain-containing protein [Desulfobacterales bacterium]
MARGDQLARQWKIIQALIASRRGRSVPELAAMVAATARTVYRDLEALQFAGFPVTTERDGHRMVWSLIEPARHTLPIPLSLPELTALYFGRSLAGVLKGTVFYDALESLFAKIKALLPGDMLQLLDRSQEGLAVAVAPAKAHEPYRAMIELVGQSILQRRRLEVVYRAMHGRADTRRRVAPYKLLFFEGSFYLLGHCGLRRDIRVFALDRIREIDLTDEPFELPEGLSIEDFLKSSFGVFHGPPTRVKIRFSKRIAGYITEKVWHPSQRVSARADGSVIFEVEVAGTEEIKHWVLKWGARAEVLAPPALRAEIRREAEAMLKVYRA